MLISVFTEPTNLFFLFYFFLLADTLFFKIVEQLQGRQDTSSYCFASKVWPMSVSLALEYYSLFVFCWTV